MLRHICNSQQLVLYATVSAGAGFLARLYPPFYLPILLIRLGIAAYCFVVLFKAEGQKELAILIGTALSIGFVGSQLDILEIEVRYSLADIVAKVTALGVFLVTAFILKSQLSR